MFIIQRMGPDYILEQLTEKVRTETQGRYLLTVEDLHINPWTVSAGLNNLHFSRDTLIDTLSGINLLDDYEIDFTLKTLELDHFHLFRFLRNGKLKLDELVVEKPALTIRQTSPPREIPAPVDTIAVDTLEFDDFSDSARQHVPAIEIGEFLLDSADFFFFNRKSTDPEVWVKGLGAELSDFNSKQYQPILSAQPLIRFDTLSALVSKGIARLTVTGFAVTDTLAHLDSLHFGFIVDPYQINRIKGFRAGWMDFQGRNLDIYDIDYRQAVFDSTLAIRRISLDQFQFLFFKDKADPRLNPAYKALPPEIIRNIPIAVNIDTIDLQNGDMTVKMQAAEAYSPGTLTINAINARILHFTNQPQQLAQDPYLQLRINAKMMNQGPVDLQGKFKIDAPDDYYDINATVGAMPATSLNDFLGSQFFFQFSSGEIQNMTMSYIGNKRFTKGTLDLEYSNLRFQKLDNFKKFRASEAKNGLLLRLGNLLILPNHNAQQKGYKTGVIYYEKPVNRDVVHCLVQSMLSGIVSNLGFGLTTEKGAKKKAKNVGGKKQKVDQ